MVFASRAWRIMSVAAPLGSDTRVSPGHWLVVKTRCDHRGSPDPQDVVAHLFRTRGAGLKPLAAQDRWSMQSP